jgi:hypothetical protein
MYEFRKAGTILSLRMRQALGSKRVLIGYLLGFFIGFFKGLFGRRFFGGDVQIFEIYMILISPFLEASMILLGYLIVIADAPFVNSLTQLSLLRGGRKAWLGAMISYLVIQTGLYYGIVFLGTALLNFQDGSLQNQWSEGMRFFIRFTPRAAIVECGLVPFSEQLLKTWPPYAAFGHSFLLFGLYSLFLSCIMFVGNLNSERALGTILAVGIHFLGVLLLKIRLGAKFSLLAYGILDMYASGMVPVSPKWGYLFWGVSILIVYLWGKWRIKRVDFLETDSDRMW